MKLLLTTIFVSAISFCFAQKKVVAVSFLKFNGKYVEKRDSADYLIIVSEPDSGSVLYNVAEYYKDGKKKLIGKSSKIDPPVFEGQCAEFYNSGKKEWLTSYKNGLPVGEEFDFYPNGKLYQIKEYPDNSDRYNNITNNFLIKANYDSLGAPLVENGNGYYKGYDNKFAYLSEEGSVKNGKRDGMWKGNFKNSAITFTENYKNGELINGTSTSEDGKTAVYIKTRGTPPEFKGGLNAFGNYLGSNIQYPDDARANNIQGRVILTFIVEKDGRVTNVVVSRSVSPSIDAEAARVIKNSPAWIPGTQFGHNVRVTYSVPVSFSLTGNQ